MHDKAEVKKHSHRNKKEACEYFLKGKTFPTASSLYSDSETINPARKAPRDNESPIEEVIQATAKQTVSTLNKNNSRLRVRAT